MPTSARSYRLWILTVFVVGLDLLLTCLGIAYNISAIMAPKERYVSLYRNFHTRYVTDFGITLHRHLTYHLTWALGMALPMLLLRLVCLHIVLVAALAQLKLLLLPYLVWNFMCMLFTTAALVAIPTLTGGVTYGLSEVEYNNLHHYWSYMLVCFLVLQATYELAVGAHYKQLHTRFMIEKHGLRPRSLPRKSAIMHASKKRSG